jgi:hypothetical protein
LVHPPTSRLQQEDRQLTVGIVVHKSLLQLDTAQVVAISSDERIEAQVGASYVQEKLVSRKNYTITFDALDCRVSRRGFRLRLDPRAERLCGGLQRIAVTRSMWVRIPPPAPFLNRSTIIE